MSSPIPSDASPSSLGPYVPIHRRTPSSSSPSPTSTHHTLPVPGVYTPEELLLLSASPLAKLSAGHMDALYAIAPEVVQTRKQRKALAWHARQPVGAPTHRRTPSRGSPTSESEEDKATTWRRI